MLSLTNCSNDELFMIMECFEVSCGFKDPPDWKDDDDIEDSYDLDSDNNEDF